jgi:tetratricopeptide (TPR) repeat protein
MLGVFAFFLSGSVIGIRCSSNSQFLQDTFGTPTDRQGCVVLRVSAGAKKAGIQRGDLIVEADGVPVTSGLQITKLFEDMPRRERRITVLRHAEELEFQVRPAKRETFAENPVDPFFYYLRARGEADKEPDKAIRDYSRVIELEPRFDLAFMYRGQLLDEKGQYEAGLEDYLKALELGLNLGEVHRSLARNGQRGGSGAAHFDIRRAIELDRCEGAFEQYNVDCAEDFYTLATLQDHFLDLNEPIENAKRAIKYWPRAVEAYYVLAVLYERIGATATAADYARQYLEFPKDERYDASEGNAKRIRDLAK